MMMMMMMMMMITMMMTNLMMMRRSDDSGNAGSSSSNSSRQSTVGWISEKAHTTWELELTPLKTPRLTVILPLLIEQNVVGKLVADNVIDGINVGVYADRIKANAMSPGAVVKMSRVTNTYILTRSRIALL